MPNAIVRASATALPIPTRRLFLAAGSAAAVFATVKLAAANMPAASHPDAELLALGPAINEADHQQKLAIDAVAEVDEAIFAKRKALGPAPTALDSDPEWNAAIEALRKASQEREVRQAASDEASGYAKALAAWKAQYEALESERSAARALEDEANERISAVRDEILSWQPETLEGLIFKARYAFDHYPGDCDNDVARSIVDDLLAIAETGLIAYGGRA